MRQSKLVETLHTLSVRERSRWRQYVWSDFANRHKALRALCDVLLSHTPALDETRPKHLVFAEVFDPKEAYNELKINNLISDLYELLLDWLALERQWADPLEQQRQRTLALLERDLNKQAAAALEKYRLVLHRSHLRNANWYRHAMYLEEMAEILNSRQPRRTDSPHLLLQMQYAHYIETLEKLRLGVALRSRSNMAVFQAGSGVFLPSDLQVIRQDQATLAALPVAQSYLAAHDLLEHPSAATFQALTSALDSHYTLFEKDDLSALYQCALNHCIRRINAGHPDAYADALALYRTLMDRGLLLQRGGKLSQWTYKNIATTGLRSGAFEWTETFLHQYRDALPADERDNAFAFNLATLYFEKQELALTLQTLQNVEFTEISYHFGAKILQLKTFYLLGEAETLLSLLATSEQLLRRDKTLSQFGKTTNLNFLRMFRQMLNWKHKKTLLPKKEAEQKRLLLLEKIAGLQPLANKDWLLKVLETEK